MACSITGTLVSTVSLTIWASTQTVASFHQQCFCGRTRTAPLGDECVLVGSGGNEGVIRLLKSSNNRISNVHRQWGKDRQLQRTQHLWRARTGLNETALTERQWGPPISLGTAQLPQDVDLKKLENLLYQAVGKQSHSKCESPSPGTFKVHPGQAERESSSPGTFKGR